MSSATSIGAGKDRQKAAKKAAWINAWQVCQAASQVGHHYFGFVRSGTLAFPFA